MDFSKMSQEEINAYLNDIVTQKMQLTNRNRIELAGVVVEKKMREGGAKLDKETKMPTGEFWDNSYSVDFCFQGGSFNISVTKDQHDKLEADGSKYLAIGYVTINSVIKKGDSGDYTVNVPAVKFTSFEKII